MMPQSHHPRHLWPVAPTPDLSLPAAAESTATQHSPQQSTAAPTFAQHTEVSIQPSDPLLKPAQPPPSTLPSAVESLNLTATPKSINLPEESGDMSGDFAKPDDSDDMSRNSPATHLY